MEKKVAHQFTENMYFDLMSESTDDYLYIWSIQDNSFKISKNAFRDFKIDEEIATDVVGSWSSIMYPPDLDAWLEDMQLISDGKKDYHNMEYRLIDRYNNVIWVSCRGKVSTDEEGKPLVMVGRISNIGKQNKFDNVTGVRNRNEFEDNIKNILENGQSSQGAVVFLDIDNFKNINERYGHQFGNRVLRTLATKVESLLPSHSRLYRLDGDEFAFIIKNATKETIEKVYEKIKLFITKNFVIDEGQFFISVSAGACLFPQDGDNYHELFRHVESAIEIAKLNGKNQLMFFAQEIHERKLQIIEMQESLHNCVIRDFDEFELYYQPQINTKTKEIVGAEALLRWHSKKHGEISPLTFIPLLEESGLIIQVGKWVFDEAIKQCKRWQQLKPNFTISINVSYIQLKESELLKYLQEGLKENEVDPHSCILELTENCWIPDLEYLNNEFKTIKELGYGIAIDDFGTGYSSLNHLKELPVNVIKIDRSFIQNIIHESYEYTFLEYIIKLAHIIDLQVCVEGVETKEEFETVMKTNPDFIQGFLFGRPVNAIDFENKFLNK